MGGAALRALPLLLLASTGCGRDKGAPVPVDTAAPPFGDNLTLRGDGREEGFPPEITGVYAAPDGFTYACAGTQPLQVYDVRDPAQPTRAAAIQFPQPAGGFRCQHLAPVDGGRLVVTHHGDETAPPWIALADVQDPLNARGLSTWSDAQTAFDGVTAIGTSVYAAAHEAGVLVFDASAGQLRDPVPLPGVRGQAVAIEARGDTLAVGTLEGELLLLDASGGLSAAVAVSGAVQDLLWLDDDTVLVACGSAGIDRVRVSDATVEAHGETGGPALDLAALDADAVAVAAWSELLVLDPRSLQILGAENTGGSGQEAVVLALDAQGGLLHVGDWQGLLTYAWDPTVSAPELALDVFALDFGRVEEGEQAAAALILRNRGPRPLDITRLSADDAGLAIDRESLQIPAYGADFVEIGWTSTGRELRATLRIESEDPDEGELLVDVYANRPGVGPGERLPPFTYLAVNDGQIYDSQSLGAPALLSYFATF